MYIVSYLNCLLNLCLFFIVYKDHSMNLNLVSQYYSVIC